MADTCEVCGRERVSGSYMGEWCSEFCALVSSDEKDALRDLKPGEFGVWPCAECGCVIEDEYTPGGCCSMCWPRREMRRLTAENESLRKERDALLARLSASIVVPAIPTNEEDEAMVSRLVAENAPRATRKMVLEPRATALTAANDPAPKSVIVGATKPDEHGWCSRGATPLEYRSEDGDVIPLAGLDGSKPHG